MSTDNYCPHETIIERMNDKIELLERRIEVMIVLAERCAWDWGDFDGGENLDTMREIARSGPDRLGGIEDEIKDLYDD